MIHVNQSKKAKNRIQQLAERNALDYETVFSLISLFWNYDNEGSWADYDDKEAEFNLLSAQAISLLQIPDTLPAKDVCIEQLLCELTNRMSKDSTYNNFIYGAVLGSSCLISEFASLYFLKNANHARLLSMDWSKKANTDKGLLWALFLKLFRAGCVDRNNLDYVYADLCIPLPCQFDLPCVEDWVIPFVEEIKSAPKLNLSNLKKLLLRYVPNSKNYAYAQAILEALAYAELSHVEGHPVKNIFLFDKRYETSSHFHSNEYHYPLRFWNG